MRDAAQMAAIDVRDIPASIAKPNYIPIRYRLA
jgi:hypothetical protein